MKGAFLKVIGAVALVNILARLFGFFREVVIGYQYGTSRVADAIITAYTIPNFLYLVVGGAITTAFISVYTKLPEKRRIIFTKQTFTAIVVIGGTLSIAMLLLSIPLLDLVFPGLDRETLEQTNVLFLWMAPSTIFLVFAMWLSGVLNLHEKYQLSALSTLVLNIVFVGIAVLFTPVLGPNSYGLGALVGSVAMAGMVIYGVQREKIPWCSLQGRWDQDMKRLGLMAFPILLGGATLQFYFFIQRIFAAQLEEGIIAALNYASKFTQFPQAVLMTAVTTVIYPMLSKKIAAGEIEEIQALYGQGLRLLGLLLIPTAIYTAFYAQPIIEIVFQYGAFTKESSELTIPLLQVYAMSMVGLATTVYVTRFFYANEVSILPVVLNVLSVFGVNIVVTLLLIDELGATAVAWGTTISSITNVALHILFAYKRLGLVWKPFGSIGLKTVIVYSLLAIVLWGISDWTEALPAIVSLALGGTLTVIIVLVGLRIMQLPEWAWLQLQWRRRMR